MLIQNVHIDCQHLQRGRLCSVGHLSLLCQCHTNIPVFHAADPPWGSDTQNIGAQSEKQTETQPVVVGRNAAAKHYHHTSRYLNTWLTLNTPPLCGTQVVSLTRAFHSTMMLYLPILSMQYVRLPLHGTFVLPRFCMFCLTHTLLCLSLPRLTLSVCPPAPVLFRFSCLLWSLFLYHCPSTFLVQVLLSPLSSLHLTLLVWSTCRVLSVSTADTEWPPTVNILAVCQLAAG